MKKKCQFCVRVREKPWLQNEDAVAFKDSFPITKGHTLVVPKHHNEKDVLELCQNLKKMEEL